MHNTRHQTGFTLTEILIALVVSTVVMSGMLGYFVANKRVNREESISTSVEANLRLALSRISDRMRYSGNDVPKTNFALWVPWVEGFNSNPNVRQGSGTDPDAIDIALCTNSAKTVLTATAAAGSETISVDDDSFFDNQNKRLLFIGGREHAHVTIVGDSLTIDVDPVAVGLQGLVNAYHAGTSVCRVDVTSYDVDATKKQLLVNKNHSQDAKPLLDGITDLQITTLAASSRYQLDITATSLELYPGTGAPLSRTTRSMVTLRN